MRRFTNLEAVFILVVFGLMHITLNAENVTGNTTFELGGDTYSRVTVNSGDSFFIERGEDLYEIQTLNVYQDYEINWETAQFMLDVGNKRFSLGEGKAKALDLDNNGEDDVMLWVESISNGQASLVIIS